MEFRRGRGGRFRGANHPRNSGAPFYEDRRGSKRSFEGYNEVERGESKQLKGGREEIHPDLVCLKNFLSQMKSHWKTQKIDKDEEDLMVCNVLKQIRGKEALLVKSDSYHLNCNVAEFLSRTRQPSVLARFMRTFNIEKVPPQHRTVKIFEALLDSCLEYFRSPDTFVTTFDSDEEESNDKDNFVNYRPIFSIWLHSLGLFVIDNIEHYFYEETIFTQRMLCALCGKKFNKDIQGTVEPETIAISDEIRALRDRYFKYLTKEADLGSLICDQQARFIVSLSVSLASALDLKNVIKRFVKYIFGDEAESILTNRDAFIVVDSVLRHAGKFGLSMKCIGKVLEFPEKISQSNPGIVSGIFAGLDDKEEFVKLYDQLSDKWTFELLTKNGAVAGACARFDVKQNDYLDKLFAAMLERAGGSEQNFIFLVRNLGLWPTFKAISRFRAQQKVLKALDELSGQELYNLACSSHVHLLEMVVSSEAIGEKIKLKMLTKLLEKVDQLAVNKFGSRLLDAVMINCQVKTIRMLAGELVKYKKMLLCDRIGKFIFLHWGLKYLENSNMKAWNDVISTSKDRKRQKLLSILADV
ncbi:hypothetical protein BIW11_10692 [Tropilaelaps mercedesae]|uniref:Nucleolar protein 9-like n=1 Tax=Tropilaelaps mercedesae TaxID=418985 RepID=A0A1V9XEH5_9ACAR|nr:hypothetical protein BIW11_10692 [Tropilaelaps mercedesae]